MKTESEGPHALRDLIRQVGVPFSLRNDNSKMQTGKSFMDICNVYTIGTERTEPHHPHQNPAENRIGTVKMVANRVMDRSGCPNNLWLRTVIFVSMLLNVIAHRQLNWRTPTEACFGCTPDISPFLRYEFYEPVYYYDEGNARSGYPVPKEKLGRWCGPTDHCGSDMTSWVLTDDTNELIARSVTRSAVARTESAPVNLRAILDSPVQPSTELFDPSALEGSPEPLSLSPGG